MYEVMVERKFSAAHQLREYNGKCENLHGHNWKVQVFIRSEKLDKTGFVIDFSVIKKHVDTVLAELDHTYLNKTSYFIEKNPTAENIAFFIMERVKSVVKDLSVTVHQVRVFESDTTYAAYFEQ